MRAANSSEKSIAVLLFQAAFAYVSLSRLNGGKQVRLESLTYRCLASNYLNKRYNIYLLMGFSKSPDKG
jgi:hypothetical protein